MARVEGDRSALSVAIDHAITHILAESESLADATPKLLARIGEALGWEAGAIWQRQDDADLLRCVATWRAPKVEISDFEELTESISFAPGVGLPGRVWAADEPSGSSTSPGTKTSRGQPRPRKPAYTERSAFRYEARAEFWE